MNEKNKKLKAIKCLQTLRNIGPAAAEDLYLLGVETPEQMKNSDPDKLYEELKKRNGGKLDICVLYQFQGAILDIPWWECKNLQLKRKGGYL